MEHMEQKMDEIIEGSIYEQAEQYDIINSAIDRLSYLTKEDFHGYRSEIWSVLAKVYYHKEQEA